MPSQPLVSAEELACLLQAGSPTAAARPKRPPASEAWLAQLGAGLWLLKGLLIAGFALSASGLHGVSSPYLWTRLVLEALCCAVFWGTLRQPARQRWAWGAALVGATTMLMDALMLLALPA